LQEKRRLPVLQGHSAMQPPKMHRVSMVREALAQSPFRAQHAFNFDVFTAGSARWDALSRIDRDQKG
jgi:hypothetical protein